MNMGISSFSNSFPEGYLARFCQGTTEVKSLQPDELELYLKEARLQEIEFHHNKGIGLLESATRPL